MSRNRRRPLSKSHLPQSPKTEIGAPNLRIDSSPFADEFVRDLSGLRAIRTYKEMSQNSPVISALLFAIEAFAQSVEWKAEPADAKLAEDVDAAKFINECLADVQPGWSNILSDALTMNIYGFAILEIVYKDRNGKKNNYLKSSRYDDGKLGWGKFGLRPADSLQRWKHDPVTGEPVAMVQQTHRTTITIPLAKCLHFKSKRYKNRPEGISLLRHAYRPWFFATRFEEIEGIGAERDLAGYPVVRIPAQIINGATANEQNVYEAYKDLVRNIRRDEQEGAVLPSDRDDSGHYIYDFQLLSAGGNRQFNTDLIIRRYEREMLMTVLADWISLGQSATGSFALSSDKTDAFATGLRGLLARVLEPFNTLEIPRLLELNAMPGTCKMCFSDFEKPMLDSIAKFVSSLASAQIDISDIATENKLRELADLPQLTEEEAAERDRLKEEKQQQIQEQEQARLQAQAQQKAPPKPSQEY